jgi:hypothetical protein
MLYIDHSNVFCEVRLNNERNVMKMVVYKILSL